MKEPITREILRGLIAPELITEISQLPIKPMSNGKYTYNLKTSWIILMTHTILPLCRHQIKMLKKYKHLLTKEERETAVYYNGLIDGYEKDWKTRPFSFPRQSVEFVNLLKQ